jgi:hypothetical protein
MKQWIIALELTALLQLPAAATELKPDVINAATFTGKLPSQDRINPLAVRCCLIELELLVDPDQLQDLL